VIDRLDPGEDQIDLGVLFEGGDGLLEVVGGDPFVVVA
jgi:hypothetical protein